MRIAYDISYLANAFIIGNRKSGLSRVIDSVLHALLKRGDIDIELTCAGHRNPLFASVLYDRCMRKAMDFGNASYIDTVKGRIDIVDILRSLYNSQIEKLVGSYPLTLRSLPRRLTLEAAERLQKLVLYQTLADHDVDVYHSPFLALPHRKITGDIPRLITIFDLIPVLAPENVPNWFARLFKKILHSIDIERDYVVCISEYTRSVFIDYTQMSPRHVFASPLAADNTFQPVADETLIKLCRASYGIPEGDYFVALADLQPRKNLARLIIAFAQFLDETKKNNVYLVLVGPASSKNNDIFRTIERFPHRIKDKYIFTGYVDEKDIAALYSSAMMFIYPSLYEGFGLPPLEAMQCGVPVITSNSTSLPEVVGKAGLLIDPLDINALSAAMCTLYENKSLRSELRENGLERATHFSWAKCADDIVKIYETAAHQ